MGISSYGQLTYGIAFEAETQFPWGEDDVEDWWINKVNGFKSSLHIYDAEGQYLGGKRPPDTVMDAYFAELRAFKLAHPLPVEVVTHCSYNYAMYIIAVPGLNHSARRGYPEVIDPSKLVATDEQREALLRFCREYGVEMPGEPRWYLSSLFG